MEAIKNITPEVVDYDCPKCNKKMVYIRKGLVGNKTNEAICKHCSTKYAVGAIYPNYD